MGRRGEFLYHLFTKYPDDSLELCPSLLWLSLQRPTDRLLSRVPAIFHWWQSHSIGPWDWCGCFSHESYDHLFEDRFDSSGQHASSHLFWCGREFNAECMGWPIQSGMLWPQAGCSWYILVHFSYFPMIWWDADDFLIAWKSRSAFQRTKLSVMQASLMSFSRVSFFSCSWNNPELRLIKTMFCPQFSKQWTIRKGVNQQPLRLKIDLLNHRQLLLMVFTVSNTL